MSDKPTPTPTETSSTLITGAVPDPNYCVIIFRCAKCNKKLGEYKGEILFTPMPIPTYCAQCAVIRLKH